MGKTLTIEIKNKVTSTIYYLEYRIIINGSTVIANKIV